MQRFLIPAMLLAAPVLGSGLQETIRPAVQRGKRGELAARQGFVDYCGFDGVYEHWCENSYCCYGTRSYQCFLPSAGEQCCDTGDVCTKGSQCYLNAGGVQECLLPGPASSHFPAVHTATAKETKSGAAPTATGRGGGSIGGSKTASVGGAAVTGVGTGSQPKAASAVRAVVGGLSALVPAVAAALLL